MSETTKAEVSMNDSVIKTIEAENQNTRDTLCQMSETLTKTCEPIKEELYSASNDIISAFGDFLYASIGDNINSSKKMTPIVSLFKGESPCYEMDDDTQSIDDFVKRHRGQLYKRITHAAVGRKIGFSYPNYNGMHTKYVEKNVAFMYLMDEHVSLVNDKRKRECLGEFLKFKKEFISELKNFESSRMIELRLPVSLMKIETFTRNYMFRSGSNSYSQKLYFCDDIITEYTTHVIVDIPDYTVITKNCLEYTGVGSIASRVCEMPVGVVVTPCTFGIISNDNIFTAYGNVGISPTHIQSRLICSENWKDAPSFYSLSDYIDSDVRSLPLTYNRMSFNGKDYFCREPNGITLNMDEIIEHPVVNKMIMDRVNMYKTFNQKLLNLKAQFADLYFVYSNF